MMIAIAALLAAPARAQNWTQYRLGRTTYIRATRRTRKPGPAIHIGFVARRSASSTGRTGSRSAAPPISWAALSTQAATERSDDAHACSDRRRRSSCAAPGAWPSVPTTVRHLPPGSLDPEDAEGSPRSCPCSPLRTMPTRVPPRTAAVGRRSWRHPRRRPRNYRPARAGGRSPRGTSCASSPRQIRPPEPAISARSSAARGSTRRPCATGAGNATPERLAR